MPSLHHTNGRSSNPPPDWVLDLEKKPFEHRSTGPHPDDDRDVRRRLDELEAIQEVTAELADESTAEIKANLKAKHGGARTGAGRKKGDASSPTTSEGRANRQADRMQALEAAKMWLAGQWDRAVTIDDVAIESFGYLEGRGWRRLPTGTLRDLADEALRAQNRQPTIVDVNEVIGAWRRLTTPSCHIDIVLDTESRSWNLLTGEPVLGVPWRNMLVHVDKEGELTPTPLSADVFHRRASIAADYLGRVEEPPAYFRQALTDWGITDEDEVSYVGALIGLCLAELPEIHGMITLFGVGGSGKSTLIKIVEGLAGGAAAATTPAAIAGRFGTWALQDHRLLAITDAPNDGDPDTTRGLGTIKAISGGDNIFFEQKGGLAYSRSWPGRVIWASNFPGRWGYGTDDYEAWERRLLPIPMPNRLGGNKIADFAEEVLEKESDELASWAITALTQWLGNGEPIPPRMREARSRLLAAGRSPAVLFALAHIEPADMTVPLTRGEVVARYREVAETEGWGDEPRDLRAVIGAVRKHGKSLNPGFRDGRRRVSDPDNPGETKIEAEYWGIRLTAPGTAG